MAECARLKRRPAACYGIDFGTRKSCRRDLAGRVLRSLGASGSAVEVADNRPARGGRRRDRGRRPIAGRLHWIFGHRIRDRRIDSRWPHGQIERSVYFYKGDVVWAASTRCTKIGSGSFLLQRGKITHPAAATRSPIRRETLASGGYASNVGSCRRTSCGRWCRRSCARYFDRMLIMERGTWSFARACRPRSSLRARFTFRPKALLVDTLRRLDELKVYRQRLPSAEVLLERVAAGGRHGRSRPQASTRTKRWPTPRRCLRQVTAPA